MEFLSNVVAGKIRESMYVRTDTVGGRYGGLPLTRVQGTLSRTSDEREVCGLVTLEDRLPFLAGESYWMPPNAIHDVEMDLKTAYETPAITVMLSSENDDRFADVRPNSSTFLCLPLALVKTNRTMLLDYLYVVLSAGLHGEEHA